MIPNFDNLAIQKYLEENRKLYNYSKDKLLYQGYDPVERIGMTTTANEKQEGGNHYKKYGDLQPWDVVIKWNLGYLEGTALKYIARWRDKNGIEDIKKAIHFLEKLVEVETQKTNTKQPGEWIPVKEGYNGTR